jgi:7,8-dihydropterin-6-yl-methyl-4-(beta-D-ribofuranosyl)aminobenzene 5'-phosphate synthase
MTENISITILVDNKAAEGLTAEQGFAVWIEASNRRILFDTGQGSALRRNSEKLAVHIEEADSIVLSHGHYDHTGGLPYAIGRSPGVDVYCHPVATVPRYSIKAAAPVRDIRMPRESKDLLDKIAPSNMHMITAPSMISPHIGITGPIPRDSGFEDTGGPFFLDTSGLQADPVADDLAIWITTIHGLVIIMGCCHAGLVNTIEYVRRITGQPQVVAVIGGLHLGEASEYRIEKTCELLRDLDLKLLIPCHCTGESAIGRFQELLGDLVKPGYAGMEIILHHEGILIRSR